MQEDVVLIDNLFDKIKIRKIILIYICAIALTFAIVAIPFVNNICLEDKAFREVILNLLIILWFYIILSKENVFIKSKIINCIKNVDYKKIAHLYILNIGIYIGIGFCFFIGDKSSIKLPSTMYIIYGITLAPIVEELIFRGVILNRLKTRFSIISAIFISAILFGIAHFDINILGRLIFELLCAILFFQTKNILNCIILHLLNNASIFMFPVLSKCTNFSINTDSEFKTAMLMIIIFSCFVSSIVFSIIYIKNNLPRKKHTI
ncbi:hypothetical protein K144312032_04610 [Clostridium tetani]|uniref:CPBP family intramembrane glutamic endopeptidase n=1 Tax=Clostridium tetani TaxID=1513 RepID=UPI0029544C6B|nr:CPBP family intramembrane glutamic endopeptidase [Clostridium tetani]BDR66233.1 hypothetical protein K144312032_04610 [Clostridium tetani]